MEYSQYHNLLQFHRSLSLFLLAWGRGTEEGGHKEQTSSPKRDTGGVLGHTGTVVNYWTMDGRL